MTSKYLIFPCLIFCSNSSKIPSFYEKSGPSISGMCFLFPFLPSFIVIQEMLDEKVLDEEACGGERLSREDRSSGSGWRLNRSRGRPLRMRTKGVISGPLYFKISLETLTIWNPGLL